MYDAIVVGARCAGSPLAMVLAREGFRILLVDRDTFPSDILSTHYIHPPGVNILAKWGLLDEVLASNCPPLRRSTFGFGPAVGQGEMDPEGKQFGLAPRRYVLDNILIRAASAAGAEVREGFSLQGLGRDGETVTGISGRDATGAAVVETARIVVGADGLHSRVARLVDPVEYNRVESLVCAYYAYFSGVDIDMASIYLYGAPGAGALAFPTNDGRLCVAGARQREDMDRYRSDIESTFFATLEQANPDFAARVRAGKREERFLGSGDLPHYFRKPYGPGWALVGDAGLHLDPTMGLGITKAFSEVELLAPALAAGLRGEKGREAALAEFHAARDRDWVPMAQQNLEMASGIGGANSAVRFRPWSEIDAERAAAV
jgi:2-polyprenyl-6-methoxyphenol hydroxylase-like FAD-dependent oxidoreductase